MSPREVGFGKDKINSIDTTTTTQEQHEIVRRVEQQPSSPTPTPLKAGQQRPDPGVNSLTQSIPGEGLPRELTAQWRAENPELISGENSAAALLEKIGTKRAASGGKTRVKSLTLFSAHLPGALSFYLFPAIITIKNISSLFPEHSHYSSFQLWTLFTDVMYCIYSDMAVRNTAISLTHNQYFRNSHHDYRPFLVLQIRAIQKFPNK